MCSQNSGSLLGERPTEGSLKEGAGCLPGTAVINTERTKGNVLVTCPFAVTKATRERKGYIPVPGCSPLWWGSHDGESRGGRSQSSAQEADREELFMLSWLPPCVIQDENPGDGATQS